MKNTTYLALLIVVLFASRAHAQKMRTLFYDELLYGKVKQTIDINYLPGTMIPELTDTTWYDEAGNTIENHRKSMRGSLFIEKYVTSNGPQGKKMEIISHQKDQEFAVKFDAAGNLTEHTSHFKNGYLNFRTTYKYDDRNNLIEFSSFNVKRTIKYDGNDRRIAVDVWTTAGTLDTHTDYEYAGIDKAGNWTKRIGHSKKQSGKTEDIIVTRKITYY